MPFQGPRLDLRNAMLGKDSGILISGYQLEDHCLQAVNQILGCELPVEYNSEVIRWTEINELQTPDPEETKNQIIQTKKLKIYIFMQVLLK